MASSASTAPAPCCPSTTKAESARLSRVVILSADFGAANRLLGTLPLTLFTFGVLRRGRPSTTLRSLGAQPIKSGEIGSYASVVTPRRHELSDTSNDLESVNIPAVHSNYSVVKRLRSGQRAIFRRGALSPYDSPDRDATAQSG